MSEPVAPYVWGVPIEIGSVPGTRKGVRSQRFPVAPQVWVTVHEDGRITLGSYHRHLRLTALVNSGDGSTLTITTEPIPTDAPAEPVDTPDGDLS
jgi:hypothetical protein